MKTIRLSEEEINYNIYNALNLYNEELGEEYLCNGFNPFENNFELSEQYIIERFVNSAIKKELKEPEFIFDTTKKIKQAFLNSINNCQQALSEIESKLSAPNLPETIKQELKKLKTYLLCRIQLLNLYCKKIKKNKNVFKLYSNIQSLDWHTSEIFEESYKEQFDIQIAINAYIEFAKQHSKIYKKELENKHLIEKAKQILRNNAKQEELLNQAKQSNKEQKQETTKQTQTQKSTSKVTAKKQLTTKSKDTKTSSKQEERSL